MKYLWLLLLIVGLSYTWAMGGADRDQQLAMMSDRQLQLADLITQSIRRKRPEVTAVNFSQLYTEVIKPDQQMIAHYRYEITSKQNDETSTEIVEGSSKLVSENGTDWSVVSSNLQQPVVGFQKGETVTRREGKTSAPAGDNSETH